MDTQTLIWGGLRRGVLGIGDQSPADAEKEERSRLLMFDLDEAKARIVIASVVVAELLLPIDLHQHGNFLAVISQRFFCPPFDLPATSLAAKLWQYGHSLPPEERSKRTVLKADAMIVATAKIHGAKFFYTDDVNCRKLAEVAGLVGRPLPTHSLSLFPEANIVDANDQPETTRTTRQGRGIELD